MPDVESPSRLPAASAAALRVLGGALLDDVEALADRLTVMVLAREPVYAKLDMVDELRSACQVNLLRGMQVLAGQVPGGVDPADSTRRTGALRAQQGVPLEAVLHAFRLGGRVMWEALLDVSRTRFAGTYDDAILDAASFVWRVNDSSSSAVVEAYRQEETRLHSLDLSRRHAVLDGLIDGRGSDPAFARDAATVLGIPDDSRVLCVVAPSGQPGQEQVRAPQEQLAALGVGSAWFLRRRDEVGIVALGQCTETAVLDVLRRCAVGRVGVSPAMGGVETLDVAYRLACTAARTLREPGLAVLDERLPEALVADSPELAPRLVQVALGGLTGLPEADRTVLLNTLRALLAAGGSPTRAAAALFCHRNTVIYRMRRIETLTERALGDPRDRLLLTLAMMALHPDPTTR
jgi:hypothetical protein